MGTEWLAKLERSRSRLFRVIVDLADDEATRLPVEASQGDEEWSIVDVLWHVGESEDRARRAIAAALLEAPVQYIARSSRPRDTDSVTQLTAWLRQTREGLMASVSDLNHDALEANHAGLWGSVTSIAALLTELSRHEQEHAGQIRDRLRILRNDAPRRNRSGQKP